MSLCVASDYVYDLNLEILKQGRQSDYVNVLEKEYAA